MKRVDVTTLIQKAYGRKYRLYPEYTIFEAPRNYLAKMRPMLAVITEKRFKIVAALLLAVLLAGSIYYFNLLVQTEQDVLAAGAKVDALQQRRNDISINLSKAVLDYSQHEQSVFTAVVGLRSLLSKKRTTGAALDENLKKFEQTAAAGAKIPVSGTMVADPLSAWSRLLAVAEQYPDLKLSSNFQSLMTALIEVEKDLAAERIRYNDTANLYTTVFQKFPTNFYAWVFGFKALPYFEATHEAKRFKPIEY